MKTFGGALAPPPPTPLAPPPLASPPPTPLVFGFSACHLSHFCHYRKCCRKNLDIFKANQHLYEVQKKGFHSESFFYLTFEKALLFTL